MKIIAETSDYVVVEKPSGVLAHAVAGQGAARTVAGWLVKKYPAARLVGDEPKTRPGIVHRLDRAASGLMVTALTPAMFAHLKQQFQEHSVDKEYLVLVHGRVLNDHGEINLPMARQKSSGRMAARPAGDEEARAARTFYEIIIRFSNATFLRVKIITGRSHQIRVHLRALGHSVVGDDLYAPKKIAKSFPVAPRLFLHCAKLGFTDLAGVAHAFTSELPSELADYLKNFSKL